MTTGFIADPEITAGAAPFGSMRQNPPPATTELCQEMGEFMAQGAVNLDGAVVG